MEPHPALAVPLVNAGCRQSMVVCSVFSTDFYKTFLKNVKNEENDINVVRGHRGGSQLTVLRFKDFSACSVVNFDIMEMRDRRLSCERYRSSRVFSG